MCSRSFFEKPSTVTYCLYKLIEFSIKLPVMYVNIKKNIENKNNYIKRL